MPDSVHRAQMFVHDVLVRLGNTRQHHVLKDRLNTKSHRNRSNFLRRQSKASVAPKRRSLLNTVDTATRDVGIAVAVHKGAVTNLLRELRQRLAEEDLDPELAAAVAVADDARAS